MRVLIIGAGETGFYIASEFSEDNFEVTVIDEDPQALKLAQRSLNVAGVEGNGTSLSVLELAGIESADLLIACTDHDETNLICCLLANNYDVKHKIAVTRTDSFISKKVMAKYLESGITQIINTSVVTAQKIVETTSLPSAREVSAFGEKSVLLVGYKVKKDSPWKDQYLKEIRSTEIKGDFLIASIVRDERSFIPRGDDQVLLGDYVYVLIPRDCVDELNTLLNVKIFPNRKAVICGENQTAARVAQSLLKSHYHVTMICRDELSTVHMEKKFANKKTFTAVQGNSESVKLQLMLDVPMSSLFISIAGDDNQNIVSSIVAKYLGATKTICLVNSQDLSRVAEATDIDVVVSTRLTTARMVKKLIRQGTTSLNYTTISETNMEVMEMVAGESSEILGIPLKDIQLPENSLFGALLKEEKKAIIPDGTTTIEVGNKVIMVTVPESASILKLMIEGDGTAIEREQAET